MTDISILPERMKAYTYIRIAVSLKSQSRDYSSLALNISLIIVFVVHDSDHIHDSHSRRRWRHVHPVTPSDVIDTIVSFSPLSIFQLYRRHCGLQILHRLRHLEYCEIEQVLQW